MVLTRLLATLLSATLPSLDHAGPAGKKLAGRVQPPGPLEPIVSNWNVETWECPVPAGPTESHRAPTSSPLTQSTGRFLGFVSIYRVTLWPRRCHRAAVDEVQSQVYKCLAQKYNCVLGQAMPESLVERERLK